MSEKYKPADLRPGASKDVERPIREVCYALISDKQEIVHVFSPGTSWTKAKDGARFFDTGYGQVICDVTFEVEPYYKIYRAFNELETSLSNQQKTIVSSDFSKYVDMPILPLADRKFEAKSSTNFLGIKEENTIIYVFPRGTSMEQIKNLSVMMKGDIVFVKARATYTITGLAKIEKTFDQLKQGS